MPSEHDYSITVKYKKRGFLGLMCIVKRELGFKGTHEAFHAQLYSVASRGLIIVTDGYRLHTVIPPHHVIEVYGYRV